MNKIPCASQNTEDKTLPADVCIFGSFGQLSLLLSTQLTANLIPAWSGIYLHKNSFLLCWNSCKQRSESSTSCFWLTVSKCGTHFENTAFSKTNIHAKWWIHCLLISTPLLSHATSIYNQSKRVCGKFWCFPEQQPNLSNQAFSIICFCTTMFKVNIPPLNRHFWWSRVQIALIKPLLCLNSIFSPHQKAMLYQHTKFWFFHRFENLQQ